MAAYCTVSDIEVEHNLDLSNPASSVRSEDVKRWIDRASARIDMSLKDTYQLPIDAENAERVLNEICVDMVGFRVAKRLRTRSGTGKADNRADMETNEGVAYRDALRFLEKIENEEVYLEGAERLPGSAANRVSSSFIDSDGPKYGTNKKADW